MILRILPFLLASALALLAPGTAVLAQARCVDSLAGASWRSTPLRATGAAEGPAERDADRYIAGMLPTLQQSFRDPSAALIPPGAMVTVPPEEQRAAIRGAIAVSLTRDGRVVASSVTTSTGHPALDSALVRAAREAGGGRGFGRVPRKFRGDTLHIAVTVSDRALTGGAIATLGIYSTSYLVADVPPRIRSMPPARAPRGRRAREVTLAATVSAKGRVVPGTIRVVSTNDSSLIAVARASLERAVYRPGTRHGCPAESNIRQRFPFQ